MKKIGFSESKKTGRDFVKSVKLTNEQGFTYGAGLQTLSSIISSDVDDAKVKGNSLTLRTGFSYDAAANMASSKGAFIDATKFKFMSMMEASSFRIEQQMLYGGSGLGIVDAAPTNPSGTLYLITLSDASWSAGSFIGQEGAEIDVHVANTLSKRNTGAAVIQSVDSENKQIVVDCPQDLTVATVAGDVLYFRNSYGSEMVGLRSIISNTGTLYGVDGSLYSLWQGNTSAVAAANLTLKKIYEGIAKAVNKGLMEDVVVLVSPASYATLANDEASLRRYNVARGQAENGFESIKFYGQNGVIEIIPHALVREEEAMAFPIKKAERIGATDITFKTPGKGDEMFQQLANETGYECRLYSEQAIFLPCPSKCVLFTGISNA